MKIDQSNFPHWLRDPSDDDSCDSDCSLRARELEVSSFHKRMSDMSSGERFRNIKTGRRIAAIVRLNRYSTYHKVQALGL